MGTNTYPSVGASMESQLVAPTPLKKELNSDSLLGRYLPTPDNDGSHIRLPATGTGDLERYNAAGTQVWVVDLADINTAFTITVTAWTGVFWLDTTDASIWVWVYDEGAPDTYYLVKVLLTDGSLTNVGSCQPGDGLFGSSFSPYYASRAAMGSGNLTIRDGENKIVIDTSDGSIVTAASVVAQNGITITGANGYETADGTIYVISISYSTATGASSINMQRGGSYRQVLIPRSSPGGSGGHLILWGDYVALFSTGTGSVYNSRFFTRPDIDAWLKRICDFYGLPE